MNSSDTHHEAAPPRPATRKEQLGTLALRNALVTRALDMVRRGRLEEAQALLSGGEPGSPSLGDVFRMYQDELHNQTLQLGESQTRVEQALGWFGQLFRNLPVAAVMVDRQGLVVDANQCALQELGLDAAVRSVPLPLRRLMADAAGELRLAAALAQAGRGQVPTLEMQVLRTPDGQLRTVDIRITRLPPRPGDEDLLLCVLNDRTQLAEAQRAREAAAASEHRRELAESSARIKTQMLSRLSHELRTPLNAVIGFSHLLLTGNDPIPPQHTRRVQLIQDAGQHLLDLVEDVLQLNRSGAAGAPLPLQPVVLADVVDEVLAMQQTQIAGRRLEVMVHHGVEPTRAAALADPRRVREVLNNLVSNAIKYNRHAGMLTLQVVKEAGRAGVAVSDTGMGLTPQQREHLFEPFNRLGAETGSVQGHGLGLSIARNLAQAMGGDIEVHSEPGVGSTFTLWLPRPPGPAATAPLPLDAG